MPRNAATNRFRIRNQNASIFINGTDGAAGNALSIANNASLSPTAAVTLELWFRPTARKAAILFDNSTLGVTNSYYLSISADGGLLWYSTIGGVAKNIIGTTTKVKFNEWNMVNATYDGAAIKLFLNGSQLAETLAATGSMGTNSGPLRIGAYYSGGTSQTFQGSISQPRVYATWCTLAEHQDRYYRSITSAALQAALVLDLNTERGASSTSNDLSGLGNNATLGASASWTSDSPFKSRKASVNANMVRNGDFEYAPPFTAATANQTDRWIDGTSGGSTTNNLFGWKSAATSVYSGGTSYSMRYDTILSRSCIRIVSVGKIYKSGSIITQMGAYRTAYTASSLLESDRLNMIEVQPNTTYTLTGLYYINQCDAQVQPRVQAVEYNAALTRVATTTADTLQDTSVAWRTVTTRFTTSATSRYVSVAGVVLGIGADFTDGNCDVAFTGVSLTPVYPEGRVPANGNLVKNFDFEVAPTFVAATSTAGRWIDGTASGSTTNSTYKWAIASAALTASASASFDTTVFRNGTASLKLDRTDATGAVVVANVLNAAAGGSLGTIPINPGVSYTFNIYAKTSTVGTDTVYADVRLFNAAGSTVNTKSTNKLSGTNDWTLLTVTFTADADATNCCIILRNAASATVGPAWFDDIYLAPTTNPGRVVIT